MRSENKSIAIIGGRGSGKSHYLANLYRQLEAKSDDQQGVELSPYDDTTDTRFHQEFLSHLQHHRLIPPTPPVSVSATTNQPLQFELRTRGRRLGMNTERLTYMTFFDTAGEDLTSFETMTAELRYICSADGIIFLLDPLQMAEVRDQAAAYGVMLPPVDRSANPAYIVQRVRDLFLEQGGVEGSRKIDVPIAFALSKIDALFPLIDQQSELRRAGAHRGKVNLAEIDSVNTEIASYLGAWSSSFYQQVELNFSNYRYFGVSSLGKAPTATGRVETVAPIRVEDPLLWLLHEFGMIGGERRA